MARPARAPRPGQTELVNIPSSPGLESYPSWPFQHPDNDEGVERRQLLLQRHNRKMDELRREKGFLPASESEIEDEISLEARVCGLHTNYT